MNSERQSLEPVRWSAQRWISTIGAVFLLQLGAIVYLGDQPQPATAVRRFRTRLFLAVDPSSERQLAQLPAISDPTLFALANVHGFSGEAWLKYKPLTYELPNWTEPPRWLSADGQGLGQTLVRFVASNAPPPLPPRERPLSGIVGWEIYVPPEATASRSQLKVESSGSPRQLVGEVELPSWHNSDILNNTIVQVLVDDRGRALSATPLVQSGFAQADRYALRLAAVARFTPTPENRAGDSAHSALATNQLSWVRLIFQWHTLPATNQPAKEIPARAPSP